MKKIFFTICVLSLCFSSCKKFLAESSQNKAYVSSATDLNELLVGNAFISPLTQLYPSPYGSVTYGTNSSSDFVFPYLEVLNDDAEEFVSGNPSVGEQNARVVLTNLHRWQADPMVNTQGKILIDYDWIRMYKYISVTNAIISKAQLMSGSEDQTVLNRVEGEALFLRANYYFLLVNVYGMPYSKATADTDMGVPLKTTEAVIDGYFKRDNVAAVYNQILTDLNRSASLLQGITQPNIYRVRQAAANALLSRVNLYMENYQAAIDAADKVIAAGYVVSDLNSYGSGTSFINYSSSENIFSNGATTTYDVFVDDQYGTSLSYKVSPDLISAYQSSDLRLNAFFSKSTSARQTMPTKYRLTQAVLDGGSFTPMSGTFLLRLPEILLNKAESQALKGDEVGAKTTLLMLLSKRFKPADVPVINSSGEDLVNYIRNERRRELCFEGQRWFDLRRYAVNSVFPYSKTIKHLDYEYSSSAGGAVTVGNFQLKPFSQDMAAYMMPIPVAAIQFNQGTLTNMTRPSRPIQP